MSARLLLILGVVAQSVLASGQAPLPDAAGSPSITLVAIGSESVRATSQITLRTNTADVFGEVTNANGRQFGALVRRRGGIKWLVAGHGTSEPGGVFTIPSVQFPDGGEFELFVALFEPGTAPLKGSIDEEAWRKLAVALSQRVTVSVIGMPTAHRDGDTRAPLGPSILSFANTVVSPDVKTAVPPNGNLVVSAPGLSPATKIWGIKRVPSTERSIVFGPAQPADGAGRYVFPGVSLDTPGDPHQTHVELSVFAADTPVRIGPLIWNTFLQWDVQRSAPVAVVIDAPALSGATPRLPFVALTTIGGQRLDRVKQPLFIRDGQSLEIATLEGAYEGDLVWILTRASTGGQLWRVHGPALKRAVAWDAEERRQRIAWVWFDLRFDRPNTDEEDAEYEVMVVLSTSLFPNARVQSSFLTSQAVHAISDIVRVHVDGLDARPRTELVISSIQTMPTDGARELVVGERGPVEIDLPGGRPDGGIVYLVRHKMGAPTYSLYEAVDRGVRQIVPDLSFANPHFEEGAAYQLMAVSTMGKIPATELSYEDLVRHVVDTSDIVTVRHRRERFSIVTRALAPFIGLNGLEQALVLLTVVVLVCLAILLGRWITNRTPSMPRLRPQPYFETGAARFLLGLVLLVTVIIVIKNHHLPILANVIGTVMTLDARKSVNLAVWLITIKTTLGILLDLSSDYSKFYAARNEINAARCYRRIAVGCLLVAVILWCFEGALYYTMLSFNSFGLIPLLGGVAFGLIAFAETALFFFITKLLLPPMPAAPHDMTSTEERVLWEG